MTKDEKIWLAFLTWPFAALALVLLGLAASVGCGGGSDPAPKPSPSQPFAENGRYGVVSYRIPGDAPDLYSITDKDTGCQYLFAKLGYAGGLVVVPNTCENQKKQQ